MGGMGGTGADSLGGAMSLVGGTGAEHDARHVIVLSLGGTGAEHDARHAIVLCRWNLEILFWTRPQDTTLRGKTWKFFQAPGPGNNSKFSP